MERAKGVRLSLLKGPVHFCSVTKLPDSIANCENKCKKTQTLGGARRQHALHKPQQPCGTTRTHSSGALSRLHTVPRQRAMALHPQQQQQVHGSMTLASVDARP